MKTYVLVAILACFWMINSGYLKPLLLGAGVLSIITVLVLTSFMNRKDGESFPIVLLSRRLPGYLGWLVWQIVLANIDVVKRVWLGPTSISPVVFTTRASQSSEAAKVLYANSITMTPGTVTLFVRDDVFEVHALTKEGAAEVQKGEMDRRVSALETV